MLVKEENLSPEERIKRLLELEKEKRKELEEKKAELEKKKKELEELEKKRESEIKETRKAIEKQIEEIAVEEKLRFEELEEIRRRKEAEEKGLEGTIIEEEEKGRIPQITNTRSYGDAINQIINRILTGSPGFYEITNYNVMNELERIASEAAKRPMTEREKAFVELVQYHAEKLGRNDFYKDKDEANYLARELAKIDHIMKTAKQTAEPKKIYRI